MGRMRSGEPFYTRGPWGFKHWTISTTAHSRGSRGEALRHRAAAGRRARPRRLRSAPRANPALGAYGERPPDLGGRNRRLAAAAARAPLRGPYTRRPPRFFYFFCCLLFLGPDRVRRPGRRILSDGSNRPAGATTPTTYGEDTPGSAGGPRGLRFGPGRAPRRARRLPRGRPSGERA